MTQETSTMLDYSKPPPGYTVTESCGWWPADEAGDLLREDESFGTEADALAFAWSHHNAEHDPPGMWSGQARGEHPGGYGFALAEADHEHPIEADFERIDDARAAAWAWHDRRHAIVLDIDEQTGAGLDLSVMLSAALAWTDAECAEVEAYAALPFLRSIDMPQALQRVLLPQGAT